MPEAAPLYPELRVREYLAFRAALKRVPRRERKRAVDRSLELAAVADVAETPIGHLSKGYRQRVALADALVSSPPLLILDEPTAGLDPNQIIEVRRLIRELGEEHTILLSTHILPEVEAVCDRAIVIARGRLVGEGSIAALKAGRHGREVAVVARGERETLERALAAAPALAALELAEEAGEAGVFRVRFQVTSGTEPAHAVEDAVRRLVEAGAGVRSVGAERASLEEVFAELTRHAEGAPAEKASDA
jgi:ABC-2 type transport system ATP-binding protein